MGLFNKEVVYTDVLQEWRKNKVGEYNFFDKVIIEEVVYTYSHGAYVGTVGIVMTIDNDGDYDVFTPELHVVKCSKVKPYYGEFQEEMEALVESKKAMERVEQLAKELEEEKENALALYEKGKKAVEKQALNQFGVGKESSGT